MNLYVTPSTCKESVKIKSSASTRADLQMEKGDEFPINCPKSGKMVKVHVNDVRAEINKTIIFIGLAIGIVATVVLWTIYGAIGTISGVIPVLFWQQEMSAVKSFNSFMIRRK